MRDLYHKIYGILDRRERLLVLVVFGFTLLVALLETAGVASILPFIAVLSNPELVDKNHYLAAAYHFFGFTSKDAFFLALGGAVFALLVGSLVLKAVSFWAQLHFSSMRNHSIGYRLIESYLHQPYQWFLSRHTSQMASSVTSEVSQVVHGAIFPVMQIVAQGLVVICLLALLIMVDPVLAALIVVVLGGAYWLIFLLARKRLSVTGEQSHDANKEKFKVVHEAFGGIKDVKIGGLEEVFLERFRVPSVTGAKHLVYAKMVSELPSFAVQAVVFGGLLLLILYLLATRGSMQQALPTLAVYAFAGYRLMPGLQAIFKNLAELRFSMPTLDALYRDIKSADPAELVTGRSVIVDPIRLQREIKLVNLTYSYPNKQRPALDAINLQIKAKSTVGFVGSTGSGKTTCVDIILGLLRPNAGHLEVDGKIITIENVRAWQRSVGYVPQSIFLTDDTIAANIGFGIPASRIDMQAVERAAKIANLHDFICTELEQGYHTKVGERGVRLSGGQRQRIGIARALYHDPDVLIFDEATSALDNITESLVMDAIRLLASQQKTIILIAHRLSTVEKCDCIYLLEHGSVMVAGTYDELLAESEQFRTMAGKDQ